MKLIQKINESAREQESIDRGENIDTIIKDEDFYDLAYGMGIVFAEEEVRKKYPKLANKILARISEMLKKNS